MCAALRVKYHSFKTPDGEAERSQSVVRVRQLCRAASNHSEG